MATDPTEWIARRLPPRPDPASGEPRPPAAPLVWGSRGAPESDPRWRSDPPPGEGPILEWYRDNRRITHLTALFGAALLIGGVSLAEGGPGWLFDGWWGVFSWVLVAIVAAGSYAEGRASGLAAGAEWFQVKGRRWVRTYELVEVRAVGRGGRKFRLRDSGGRVVRVGIERLEMNPLLWDLVYNGILHSVHARPVETNRQARGRLRLPAYPAWKRAEDTAAE